MKTYLVGGAIRDNLLGLIPKEKDWVVVGSSPEEMKSKGFKQVGKDFPVFLHPKTGEEYALARTERKAGHGYTGFEFDIDSNVTIEQDLERRDLTINAIAQDEDGTLIDPFGGQKDIREKKLRHVSNAFSEDPLRVLRVLRFKANLEDFEIVPETKDKIKEIIASGELDYLTGERIWLELYKAKNLKNFMQNIFEYKMSFLLPGLSDLVFESIDSNIIKLNNKLLSISYMLSKFGNNISKVCEKIKAPNEYKDLADLIYENMHQILAYELTEPQDYNILLDLIKKLDIRKRERLNNFFTIMESYSAKTSLDVSFFKTLISKLEQYRLSPEDKLKNNLEIKEIIENAHGEITQGHIKEYLNNN